MPFGELKAQFYVEDEGDYVLGPVKPGAIEISRRVQNGIGALSTYELLTILLSFFIKTLDLNISNCF